MSGPKHPLAYVCGFAEDDGGGIFCYRQDEANGVLHLWNTTSASAVSFACVHPDRHHLYTVDRVSGGVVTAYRIDETTGELLLLNRESSEGSGPCYVSVDATGSYAFVANYAGGTVSMVPIAEDGTLRAATDVVVHEGSSVEPDRQGEPHPHSIVPGPENEFVYVPDLGTDRIAIYRIDFAQGTLDRTACADTAVHAGAGPRHMAFHPTESFAYVINELDSTVVAFDRDRETGALAEIETVFTVPGTYEDESYCADLHVHPSGNWLYGSNRGHDSIVIFEIDGRSGRLCVVDHESTRGHWPRNFALDPSGRFLYAENRRSNSIVTFAIDENSGQLSHIEGDRSVPEPVCMQFVDSA